MLTRLLARITIAVTVMVAGVAAVTAPAHAQQQVVCSSDGQGGQICLIVNIVTTPGGWTVNVQHQSGGETLRYCIRPASGNFVPCQDLGWYNTESDCYIRRVNDTAPAAGMPGYEQYGDEGVVYNALCFPPGGGVVFEEDGRTIEVVPPLITHLIVLGPDPEGYGGTPSPLPELIEEALNSLELNGADIVMAPNPDGAGLVGLPVWMATAVSESTWGPQSRTAGPVAGISVTADAEAQHILWEMGDGGEVTCDSPGTPYDPSYGVSESPTCGYPGYRQPSRSVGGRYAIVASTTWQLAWTSTEGAGGDFTVTTGSTTSVLINELQVLTRYE